MTGFPTSFTIRFLLCFLFGGMVVAPVCAQLSPAQQQQYDSLSQVVNTTGSDTVRLNALALQAKMVATVDSKENEYLHTRIIQETSDLLSGEVQLDDSLFLETKRAESQIQLGINLYLAGNYPKAQFYQLEALAAFEGLDNKPRMAMCCIVLGAIYKSNGDIAGSLPFHQRALELNQSVGNVRGIALAYNNLGVGNFDLDSIDLAEQEFNRSLTLYDSISDQRGMGVELLNLGRIAQKRNNLEQASEYFQRSLTLRQDINDRQGQIFSHFRLGTVQLAMGQVNAALGHGQQSLALAEEKGYPHGIRDACELLASVYRAKNDFQQALVFYERHIAARDTLEDEESVRALTRAEAAYRYEKELAADSIANAEAQKRLEAEITYQTTAKEQQELIATMLWIGLGLLVVFGLLLYSRFRQTSRQKKIIEDQKAQVETVMGDLEKRNGENELLLKEIHHRVKNNLQVISSLLDLQTKNLEDDTALSALADGQNRVKAMALIHEKLYQNESIARLDFNEYVRQLMVQIGAIYGHGAPVERQVVGEALELDIDTAIPLGLILSELLTNAYKYGVKAVDHPRITVALSTKQPGNYAMEVRDNGSGMPDDFDLKKAKSLGLRLVRRLSQQLYGKAQYHFDEGAVFTVSFQDTLTRKAVE